MNNSIDQAWKKNGSHPQSNKDASTGCEQILTDPRPSQLKMQEETGRRPKFLIYILFFSIVLIAGFLGFWAYQKRASNNSRWLPPEGSESYKGIEDWCLKSEYWFSESTCGLYISDGPVYTIIDKSGKYKGRCGWEDNDCKFKECFLFSKDKDYKNICLDKKTIAYCEKFVSKGKKTSCYYYFSKVNKDKSICYGALNNTGYKDTCLSEFAIDNNSLPVCKEISDNNIKNQCIEKFVKSSSDCVFYEDEKAINVCYDKYYLEFQKENNEILNKALVDDDISKCSEIKGATFKEICILRFAIKDNRPDLCQNLTNKQFLDECRQKFPSFFNSDSRK